MELWFQFKEPKDIKCGWDIKDSERELLGKDLQGSGSYSEELKLRPEDTGEPWRVFEQGWETSQTRRGDWKG